ncbi:hypothetical protein EC973_001742 [Apophysomyces ossiformis]|uniref:Thioredoxin domain-containing protein n=1 Tax=Apophysomyces ossiformis TaxID=679940 RepID=A0A8H7EP43_9FUNG|nr:hypothetical protein EC973_001742 [Apophysomyces ossiformis]
MTGDMLNAVRSDQPWFIKFYAPWCGHCQRLQPIWEQLAETVSDNVAIGEVNCEISRALCTDYNVSGLPTLRFMAHGSSFDYTGERSLDDLLKYVQKMTRPVVGKVTYDTLAQLTKENQVNLIHVYDEDSNSLDVLKDAAPRFLDRVPFWVTNDPEAIARIGLGTFVMKDDRFLPYIGETWSSEHLAGWVQKESFPLVSRVERQNSAKLLRADRLVVLGIFKDESSHQPFRRSAEFWRDHSNITALFAEIDGVAYNNYIYRTYGITQSQMPAVVILDPANNLYFDRDAEGSRFSLEQAEAIVQALEDSIAGRLEGASTLPVGKNQAMQPFVLFLQKHWTPVFIGFTVIVSIMIWLLRSTREDGQPVPSPATPATVISKKED